MLLPQNKHKPGGTKAKMDKPSLDSDTLNKFSLLNQGLS